MKPSRQSHETIDPKRERRPVMATCHRARYNKVWVDRQRDRLNVSIRCQSPPSNLSTASAAMNAARSPNVAYGLQTAISAMRAGSRLDPWNARDFQPASRSITANCYMDHRHRHPASAAPASGSRSTHRGDDALRPTLYVSICRLGQRHRRTGWGRFGIRVISGHKP